MRKLLGEIKLIAGGGDRSRIADKKMCVMQAVRYITDERYRNLALLDYDYRPVCVSNELTSLMVEINDEGMSDEDRQKLLRLVPEMLNTAPILLLDNGLEKRDEKDPDYRAAEAERRKLMNEKWQFGILEDSRSDKPVKMDTVIKRVRELIAVKKFG